MIDNKRSYQNLESQPLFDLEPNNLLFGLGSFSLPACSNFILETEKSKSKTKRGRQYRKTYGDRLASWPQVVRKSNKRRCHQVQ